MAGLSITTLDVGDIDAMNAYSAILGWAFAFPAAEGPPWLAKAGLDNVRLARDGARVLGGLIHVPMGQWFGARSVVMTGIAGVAIAPEHRGRGVALALMRESLAELAERGVALSVLYPATLGLYRKVDYEPAGSRFRCSLRTADIPVGPRELAVRAVEDADHGAVAALYAAVARDQNGYLDRGSYIWDRVRTPRAEPARGYLVEGAGGAEGYLYIAQIRTQRGHYDLGVVDLCSTTERAGRCLLGVVAEHRTLGDRVTFSCGGADPVLSLLPERYHCELGDHWMLRVVDAEAALSTRGYPVAASARLELELDDPLLRKNHGRIVLDVERGQPRVTRGGSGALRAGMRGLAALYSGFMHPVSLARIGLIDGDARTLATAAALFAGPAPCMRDGF